VQPVQPIIVQVVDAPATPELGIGQIIVQALGLTGIILLASMLVGAAVGGFFIYLRQRQARERLAGEAGDQIRLRLEPPARTSSDIRSAEAGVRH
jgi:hypothetical protein